MTIPVWWKKPRKIFVLIDENNWALPYAEELLRLITESGESGLLLHSQDDLTEGTVVFYIGWEKIVGPEVLRLNKRNLVVHASDLPNGRGFSPLTWLTISGETKIPVCLLEADEKVDSGAIIYKHFVEFEGHELIDEMRVVLGKAQIELCRKFLLEVYPPIGTEQAGTPTYFRRRLPSDSKIDSKKPIDEQFDLLRTVDNEKYPAFFETRGHRYKIFLKKCVESSD